MSVRLRMSSKGQVVVPSAMRLRYGWGEGSEFEAVDSAAGVMLRVVPATKGGLTIDEALARVWAHSPKTATKLTDEDMHRAVVEEAARQDRRTRS